MGVVALPGYVSVTTLQRLSALLPSGASPQQKQAVAALVCDSRTETLAADVNKQEAKKKLCLGSNTQQFAPVSTFAFNFPFV